MKEQNLKKILFLFISILLIYLSFLIIKPYLVAIVGGFILAYLFFPIYRFQLQKFNFPKTISAITTLISIFLIILIPLIYILKQLISQINNLIKSGILQKILNNFSDFRFFQEVNLNEIINKGLIWFLENSTNLIWKIPSLILSILVLCFAVFYFLTQGEEIREKLIKYIPLKDKNKIATEIALSTKEIIYGALLIAMIQFLVASLGFWFFGVKSYFLFAFIIAFLAFIPGIGPITVWVPLAIYAFIQKSLFNFFGIIITGLIIDLFLSTWLRAKIINNKTKIHPLTMIVGLFGGISLFGFFGIIIGPLLLVYTIKLIEQTFKEKN
jgi:predicted PurR-regulated permease PerM